MGDVLTFRARFEDGVSKKLKDVGDQFDRVAGKGSSASLFGNVGAKAVAMGFNLLQTAAEKAGDVLVNIVETNNRVHEQEMSLAAALEAHGSSLDAVRASMEDMIATGERYAMRAGDVREAVTKLTMAGISWEDIQRALPTIMNLAIAKHISLADAADILAKSTTGSAKGLSDLGIKLNTASGDLVDVAKSTDTAAAKQQNFQTVVSAVNSAVGDQSKAVDDLDQKQAKLNNRWEKFTTKVGPAIEAVLNTILDVVLNLIDALGSFFDALEKDAKAFEKATGTNVNTFAGAAQAGGQYAPGVGSHAEGGWVGLNGPELSWLGERGPEYVVPNHQLGAVLGGGGGSPVQLLVQMDGQTVARLVDQRLFYRAQLAPSR